MGGYDTNDTILYYELHNPNLSPHPPTPYITEPLSLSTPRPFCVHRSWLIALTQDSLRLKIKTR